MGLELSWGERTWRAEFVHHKTPINGGEVPTKALMSSRAEVRERLS